MWATRISGLRLTFLVLCALRAASAGQSWNAWPREDTTGASKACQLLAEKYPDLIAFPGSVQYANDTVHYAFSSQQNSTCSIEPTSANDVSAIIQIIGRPDIRAPFAVKSGGHAYNLGQSSTPGVQISMARFTNISFNAEQSTVTLGMGLTWDQVYGALEPLGVMVAGGRVDFVGVGGVSLGGGYSWKTNQFGLTIDTVVSHELVLPSGEQVHVSNTSYPDLFFGLRGGFNNFGIVTEITLEAHSQTLVYGGLLSYATDNDTLGLINSAISSFSINNTDPKAQLEFLYATTNGVLEAALLIFYDAPTAPAGVYDKILAVPALSSDVKTRTFVNFMETQDIPGPTVFGAVQHVIPLTVYTTSILEEIKTQVQALGSKVAAQPENANATIQLFVEPEPFYQPFSHSRGGAYPHPPSRQVSPTGAFFIYSVDPEASLDAQIARHEMFERELRNLTQTIQARAVELGISRWDDILYPNYALLDSPLELIYGDNLPQLREIANKYDPDRVMTLTGNFKFL